MILLQSRFVSAGQALRPQNLQINLEPAPAGFFMPIIQAIGPRSRRARPFFACPFEDCRMQREILEQIDHDTLGRLITYGGGSAGMAFTKFAEIAENSAVYDWGYWMFGAAIFGRLIFDVVKFVLKRDTK